MFGGLGKAVHQTCFDFVSKISLEKGIKEEYKLERTLLAVENCRNISKKDMIHNDATPEIIVNPENYEVSLDGEILRSKPVDT
ncbi:urease subunit alpha, partial [Klebsiella variicola]|nr:urease subunit alpha [Klebsiella variicola]